MLIENFIGIIIEESRIKGKEIERENMRFNVTRLSALSETRKIYLPVFEKNQNKLSKQLQVLKHLDLVILDGPQDHYFIWEGRNRKNTGWLFYSSRSIVSLLELVPLRNIMDCENCNCYNDKLVIKQCIFQYSDNTYIKKYS